MEIEGFSNYLIYEDGRVYSKKRKIFMKPFLDTSGYYNLELRSSKSNVKRKHFSIHRLIALYYIDNPNGYETVDHIDRNRTNNNITNLRWASRSMQSSNRKVHSNTGEKHICKFKCRNYFYYQIEKKYCFKTMLRCDEYSLQDAINLRDSLLNE